MEFSCDSTYIHSRSKVLFTLRHYLGPLIFQLIEFKGIKVTIGRHLLFRTKRKGSENAANF